MGETERNMICSKEEPSDDFYEFGLEDYARVMQGLQKQKQHVEKGLRTAKLREQEEKVMAAKFPHTQIRILFPNDDIIQASSIQADEFSSNKEPKKHQWWGLKIWAWSHQVFVVWLALLAFMSCSAEV